MAKAADDYAAITDEEVIVQTGYTKYDFKHVKEHFDFCPKDKMEQFMDKANILVDTASEYGETALMLAAFKISRSFRKDRAIR